MKILHELSQLELGGVERVVRNLAKYDKENQYEVLAYKDGPMRDELERAGAKVMIYGKEEAETDCDVIHVHCGGAQSDIAKSLHTGGFAMVETIHSPIKSPNRPEWIHARVGVSQTVTNLNPFARTIYNGVDMADMHAIMPKGWLRKRITKSERTIVGRIGRLGYDKGLEETLVAASIAQAHGHDFDLVIAGPEALSSPGYLAKLLIAADSLPVKNCHFVGPQRAADFLQELDIFLYPSPTEGFGLVYAEAMAMGVPIVAWGNDVAREVCGGNSILVAENIPALANGLEAALRNPTLRSDMCEMSREVVQERFAADRMAQEYAALYKELVPEPMKEGEDASSELRGHSKPLSARLTTR